MRTRLSLAIALWAAVLAFAVEPAAMADGVAHGAAGAGLRGVDPSVPDGIRDLMTGSSWRPGCPVALHDLRLVRSAVLGVRRARPIAAGWWCTGRGREVSRTFGDLYDARFPIRRMRLVDRYGADDMRSMRADNTSAFNCRYRGGECCVWSQHAYGRAVDINPVENPWVGSWGVSPPNGAAYADRSPLRKGMIGRHGVVVDAFARHRVAVGRHLDELPKDYQHLSANGR